MAEDVKAFIRRFYDRVVNLRLLDETLSSEELALEYFTPAFYRAVRQEGLADYWPDSAQVETMLDADYPESHFSLEDIIAEEDRVAVRWVGRSVHASSGRRLRWEGMTLFHLREGRIARVWSYADEIGLMRQQGKDPAGQQAAVQDAAGQT